jgi:hypothetical protein
MGEKTSKENSKANSKEGKTYVEKISNVMWAIVKLTCHQIPQETQKWVPERNNGKRRKLGHIPQLATLWG